ncbi:universal stress protein [Nocardioides coralli]|uniref:universal stress protein n=1 Tax=Nocardioides coralli TaxID=2872154 RepID=UPI001CA404E8|nr:universal stress protein [Nocardioides coralli]QZY30367.1 universal stress protein [Nocardioides coralli]
MRHHRERDAVVVGIDGSERALAAVRFGAREARRWQARLVLVHVMPGHVPLSPVLAVAPRELTDLGERLLAEAVAVARDAEPDVAVRSRLLRGDAVAQLVRESDDAWMVVLGRETTPGWARVFTGAVTMGVAERAHCPVSSVPEEWTASEEPGSVVVGFEASEFDAALLEYAVGRAADLGARLTVLHAWELPRFYDEMIVRRAHDLDWKRGAQDRIEELLRQLRRAAPDVEVEVEVVHQQPALALRDASQGADRLILGRHGQGPAVRHLGGTARALLREATCPVVVVPPVHLAAAVEPWADAGVASG